jgi:protein-S-isoprenylcysteine O-methyltransferase Ste14
MGELRFYHALVLGYPVLAGVVAMLLLFITVPYGRHNTGAGKKSGWGPQVGSRFGWLLMEVPASLAPIFFFALGERRDALTWVFLFLWQLHYVHRAFIFPFRRRGGVASMPLLIALLGLLFNLINAYLNWRYLTHFAPPYPDSWWGDPRFLLGVLFFLIGFYVNRHADWVLIRLRRPGETGYKIPYGGLYRLISCPNYFGEILQWCGWALCTFSLAGFGFAVWTAANLVPRALAHHRDYRSRFTNYPRERRAVFPFLL